MGSHPRERPLGGKVLTSAMKVLLGLAALWAVMVAIRLLFGLGAMSAQNDGYAWGIWKPLNVVTFTGIAAGAYAVGLVTYLFNRGEYHPLVRSSVMAGAMGYTLAGISVLVDLGRWWNLWVVFWPPAWNLNSVLLEVAGCVLAYTLVLWVEVGPAVLERLAEARSRVVSRLARRLLPELRRRMPFVVATALLLPSMHQSSLGGLFMITETKTHPLWHTSLLSALFLVSCVTMGFGAVVVIENLASLRWGKAIDQKLLARLNAVPAWLALGFVALRLGDLAWRGRLGLVAAGGTHALLFLVEMALFALPGVLLLSARWRANRGNLFGAGLLLLAGGTLYRFDTYLVAYQPSPGWHYFPYVREMLFSLCLAGMGVAAYALFVKLFPILSGVGERGAKAAAPAAPMRIAAGR
ncbi:MAG TPA: Ni/Fe-hydrogenase cytochrome b subunit [Anaeromyxobacter sp.]